jgi:polar amino acid transport system substrate-binding protein
MRKMYSRLVLLSLVVVLPIFANAAEPISFPHFRHVDRTLESTAPAEASVLTLLADEDFAPFSFKTADGKMTGVSVQLALAACAELKVKCQVKALSFSGLLPALEQKLGDVIVGGPILRAADLGKFEQTRPYFFAMSEFISRTGSGFLNTDAKRIAGHRLGFTKGSAQETFLRKYYDRSILVDFSDEQTLFEALRTGSLDVAFVDAQHAGFWLKGSDARNCCTVLGEPYFDRASFSHPLAFIMKIDRVDLRDSFDHALDLLQDRGTSSTFFATYLTAMPF